MTKYAILGPVELRDGERRLPVGGPRQVALLALLLVNANRAMSTDELVEALWADLGPEGAVKRLQVAVVRLRRALEAQADDGEPALRRVTGGYMLAVRPGELDADVFRQRVDEGRDALERGETARARDILRGALALWRGPALAEVAYEEFAQTEIRRLEEQRRLALEALVDAELALGEHGRMVGELETLLAANPGHERFAAQLMLALYRGGRQGEALAVYARTRNHLSGELGLEPGPALKALQRQVLDQSPELDTPKPLPAASSERTIPRPSPPLPLRLQEVERSALVGRASELGWLRERWSESESGRCRLAVVSGDAGIGKSRLVARFAAEVHRAGALVLHGCADEELLIPYQPFVEALSEGLEHAVLAPPPQSGQRLELAELGDLVPALRRALPELAPTQPAEPELRRYRLFEAASGMLRHAASDRPVLLVLDDLQFADASTLGMLRYVVQRLDGVRLLVLATVRSGPRGPEGRLGRMLSESRKDGLAAVRPLTGLSDEDVAQLVAGEASTWSDAWPSRLNRWTGGNPFFIEQLLGSLASEPESLESVVPESVRELVAWKLAELDPLAARALEVAATSGDRCALDLVEKVVGDDSDAVLDALEAAIAAGLLREGEHVGTYGFSHSLARAAVYDSIGRTRRARLHLRIGEALAAGEAEPAELAHHFWAAREVGGAEQAVDYLRAAGEAADRAVAWEDARDYYERALEALELAAPSEVERAAELMLALGDACERCGDSGEAKAVFERLAELAREHAAFTWLAAAALGVGRAPGESMGTDPQLVALLREALAALPPDALQLRTRVLARLAVELGTCAESDALSCEAVALADSAGDDVLLAIALASRRWVLWQPERLHERSVVSRRSLEAAIRAQDRERELAGRAWWLFDLLELGDMAGVETQLEAYVQIAESLRHPSYQGYGLAMRAMLALLRGDLAPAQDGVEAAFRMLSTAEDPDAPRVHALQRFVLERERGDLAASRRALEEHTSERPLWALLHGWAAADAGDCDEALLALTAAPEIRRDAEWLAAMTARGFAAAAVGSEQDVAAVRSGLLPYADRIASVEGVVCLGPVAHPLGLLAARHGDEAEAVALLTDAVATAEGIGAPGTAARARADLGLLSSLDS